MIPFGALLSTDSEAQVKRYILRNLLKQREDMRCKVQRGQQTNRQEYTMNLQVVLEDRFSHFLRNR